MKKFILTACMSLAIFAMVSCTSNPGIEAAEAFIDNPTTANLERMIDVVATLSGDELEEYNEWCIDNTSELYNAGFQCGYNNPEAFGF